MSAEHRILPFQHFSRIENSTKTRNRGLALGVTSEVTAYAALESGWPVLTLVFGAFGALSLIGAFRQNNKLQALHRNTALKSRALSNERLALVPHEMARVISDTARRAKKERGRTPRITLPDERRGRRLWLRS